MPQRPDFDLYEALEVSRTATTQEIRDSYRRLALIHHPDKNRSDAEATQRFQRISMAHEHLSDATLRHAYDNPSVRAQGFPNNGGDSCDEDFYEDDDEYTSGYTYIFRSFDDFLSQFFGPDIGELRRRAAADEADWKQKEAVRKKLRDEKQRKEEEAEERRQARANAKMYEEEEKRQSKEMRAQQEKLLQEERWSDMNATTEAEKRRTCLHSAFWPKEQQKRKLKCQSCGKKGGMIAFKCPHCSLLACQLCLNKLAKRTT